jgi:outer membrane protein
LSGLGLPVLSIIAAQDRLVKEISLNEAINLALEYNLNLRKNRIDIAASGYSESKLWAEIFPNITASASVGNRSPLFSGDGFGFNENTRNYNVGFGINLGLNAGIPYVMRSIRLAHQGNILRYEDARNQLSIQVTKKYYSLVAEKKNLLLLEEVLTLTQRQYERNQVLFRNGFVRELTVLQSRLAYENARFNLSAASISNTNSISEFLAMIGMEQNITVTLLDDVNIVRVSANSEELIRNYLPGRPDIVRSLQEIERLENAERQTLMQVRAPSLDLSVNWNTSRFSPFTDTLSGSATLRIPIDPYIQGTSRNQTINRAGDSVEKAKLDLAIAENSARTQIRSLTAFLHNSWDSILIARLGYEAAQHNYQLTEQAFNNGTIESLVLEDARNNMASARQRLFQNELSYFNMILDLSAAVNVDWNYLIQTYGVTSEEI